MSFERGIIYEDDNIRQQQVGYVGQPIVELTFQNENGVGTLDPFVAVYVNGVQHDKVWAYIDREQGADGGWYSVVKFRRSGVTVSASAGTGD